MHITNLRCPHCQEYNLINIDTGWVYYFGKDFEKRTGRNPGEEIRFGDMDATLSLDLHYALREAIQCPKDIAALNLKVCLIGAVLSVLVAVYWSGLNYVRGDGWIEFCGTGIAEGWPTQLGATILFLRYAISFGIAGVIGAFFGHCAAEGQRRRIADAYQRQRLERQPLVDRNKSSGGIPRYFAHRPVLGKIEFAIHAALAIVVALLTIVVGFVVFGTVLGIRSHL
jgi:hypothetical protein